MTEKEPNQKRVNKKKDRKKRRKKAPGQSSTLPAIKIELKSDTTKNGTNLTSPKLAEGEFYDKLHQMRKHQLFNS